MSAPPADLLSLQPTPAPGVMLKSAAFAEVASGLAVGFVRLLDPAPMERFEGCAVIARDTIQRAAYPERFPQLAAWVEPLIGADAPTAMTPAACLALYPHAAGQGAIPPAGRLYAVGSQCHRTEAAYSATRLRAFEMTELVFIGSDEQARAFRATVLEAAQAWFVRLGLEPRRVAANDPFWGRGAEVMAQRQRELEGKVEIVLPAGDEADVACLSGNLHGEFFGQRFDLVLEDGGCASSACVGVGLERLVLALVHRYGDRLDAWPSLVRDQLTLRR